MVRLQMELGRKSRPLRRARRSRGGAEKQTASVCSQAVPRGPRAQKPGLRYARGVRYVFLPVQIFHSSKYVEGLKRTTIFTSIT
jgi:hypothetical protein